MADEDRQILAVLEAARGRFYSDAIPDPETLEKYKAADPSFPERIMRMAEAHNEADIKAKNRASLSDVAIPVIGQVFAFLLGAGGIAACFFLARAGHTEAAIAAVAGGFSPMLFNTIRRRKY